MVGTPRICLATHFNERYSRIGNLCLSSLKRYGAQYGYDVVTILEICSGRPLSWDKIPVILALFARGYDFVMWVDADAAILRCDEDIAAIIQPDKDLYIHSFHFPQGGEGFNCGVFLIRNNEWSKNMLARLWEMREYVFHPWWENAALFDILKTAGVLPPHPSWVPPLMPRAYEKYPSEDIAHIGELPQKWNYCELLDTGRESEPILRHYAALPLWIREYRMVRDCARSGIISTKRRRELYWAIFADYYKNKKQRAMDYISHLKKIPSMLS